MATLNNFGELKIAIQTWMMEASEIPADVETIVRLSQPYISLKLRAREMIVVADISVADGEIVIPADFVAVRRVVYKDGSTRRVLKPTTMEKADELYSTRPSGIPVHFAVVGSKMRLYPTPADLSEVELTYYQMLETFTEDEDADWLLTKYPNIYLHCGLMYAAELLKEDDEAKKQAGIADTFIAMVSAQDEQADLILSEFIAETSPEWD
jgi:hypothetical protein